MNAMGRRIGQPGDPVRVAADTPCAYAPGDPVEYTSFAPGGWSPGTFAHYAEAGEVGEIADPLVYVRTASGGRTRVRESQVRRPGGPDPVVSVEMFTPAEMAAWQVAKDRKLSMTCADLRAILAAADVLPRIAATLDGAGLEDPGDPVLEEIEHRIAALVFAHQAGETEEPPEPVWDPGDEIDDEGGASEHRYAIPSDDVPF